MIGYAPEVEVTKTRRKGVLGEYGVCLDQVEGLGNFVEFEKLTEETANPEAVRSELFAVAESFGLSRHDEETHGYDTQMSQLRHHH
jgi:adenylate cyclase, class 2